MEEAALILRKMIAFLNASHPFSTCRPALFPIGLFLWVCFVVLVISSRPLRSRQVF